MLRWRRPHERHNLFRNCAHQHCPPAGFSSELERPGLLRPRPQVGGTCEAGTSYNGPQSARWRRPAGVYVPRWHRVAPAFLDFAATSGLRTDSLRDSARDAGATTTLYEGFRSSHCGIKDHCQAEGMTFIPMVMEASAGRYGIEGYENLVKACQNLRFSVGPAPGHSSFASLVLPRRYPSPG